MKCLNPLLIKNPSKSKDLLDSPFYTDKIIVPCGKCFSCRKRRASDWRLRLLKEMQLGRHKNAIFVSLTVDDENYDWVTQNPETAIRRFLERWRKEFKKYPRYWFVSELGEKYGRFHFHGIIFDFPIDPRETQSLKRTKRLLDSFWKYGGTWIGDTCSLATISYIVKYMHKSPPKNPHDLKVGRVWCSKGLGKCYLSHQSSRVHRIHNPDGFFLYHSGKKCALPRYYRDKLFSFTDKLINNYRQFVNAPPSADISAEIYQGFLQYEKTLESFHSFKPSERSYKRTLYTHYKNYMKLFKVSSTMALDHVKRLLPDLKRHLILKGKITPSDDVTTYIEKQLLLNYGITKQSLY